MAAVSFLIDQHATLKGAWHIHRPRVSYVPRGGYRPVTPLGANYLFLAPFRKGSTAAYLKAQHFTRRTDRSDRSRSRSSGSQPAVKICCAGSVQYRSVQIQPSKHVLDHAGFTVSTRQHELHHTDHIDHTDQESIWSERSRSSSGNRWSVGGVQNICVSGNNSSERTFSCRVPLCMPNTTFVPAVEDNQRVHLQFCEACSLQWLRDLCTLIAPKTGY